VSHELSITTKRKQRTIDTSLCVTTHPPFDFCRTLPFNSWKNQRSNLEQSAQYIPTLFNNYQL